MRTYYVDETGFTGEDLLDEDQPIFVQATNDFSADEANDLIASCFAGVGSAELKCSRLARGGRPHDKIIALIRALASDPLRVSAWVAHKEYALMTLVVDWWMEPLAYGHGLNLYKDGANHAMANMLYTCLQGFWPPGLRRKLLLHFQRMFRARTRERYEECRTFVEKEKQRVDGDREEILRYFSLSFMLLGFEHVVGVPERVLDIALTGLVQLGHAWNGRYSGPWAVVHDQSSNMSKQKWIWDAHSAATMPAARFEYPGRCRAISHECSADPFRRFRPGKAASDLRHSGRCLFGRRFASTGTIRRMWHTATNSAKRASTTLSWQGYGRARTSRRKGLAAKDGTAISRCNG